MSDTAQIILAVIGTGITLLGILVGLLLFLFRIQRQDLAAFRTEIRQDIKETNTRIDALDNRVDAMEGRLNARIDNLYQALFSHKDPAA